MNKRMTRTVIILILSASLSLSYALTILGDEPIGALHVVATSHLDTQWRWTIQKTINEYIPNTLRDNFPLFEAFPDYTFSFEGAFRYMLMKEYYPEEYERLEEYIAADRWRVAGSWVDAVDTNIPSAEALIRQTLYGNGFFKREFGKTSCDVFLPDCFGFGYVLPSVAAHCGLKGFSTQKLSWGSAFGVPFDIGIWEGVDGSSLVAELNPGAYVSQVRSDLSRDSTWIATIKKQGETSGLYAGYKYFGTGDIGGAPDRESVAWVQKSIKSDGPLQVLNTASDALAREMTEDQKAQLPRYKGELLMTRHGVGCYTSQAAMKRWNRKNELLADAAERACVIADWLGGSSYPQEALRDTWTRFLWHQFHDDLTGTSIPEAYQFSWNDEILCSNQFAGLLEAAVAATSLALDTRTKGVPLLVYNPLSIPRQDIVEATVIFPEKIPQQVRVFSPQGKEVPAQITKRYEDSLKVVFLAEVPPLGYAVYDVRPAKRPCQLKTGLKVTPDGLENPRYRVSVNADGEVASIWDKEAQRELLKAPTRLQFLPDNPDNWPAWEIDYDDVMAPPRPIFYGATQLEMSESGPARVSLKFTNPKGKSTIEQTFSLAAGPAGDRLEFDTQIDWREKATLLKASFQLTSPNDSVTYDLGLGTIKRGLNKPELYEVPGQQWADLTSASGDYGVAILNDCKYGWDHPNPETLRLTLIHTPGVKENWSWVGDQSSQDVGQHRLKYAIQGHRGDWRNGATFWGAARLNQPLIAFQTVKHKGFLGKQFSLVQLAGSPNQDSPPVSIKAIKMAEAGDEIVVRLQELSGQAAENIRIKFCKPILSAREINGAEDSLCSLTVSEGMLEVTLKAYQPRAFAVRLTDPEKNTPQLTSKSLSLPYNLDGISLNDDRRSGDFDGQGNSLVGELLSPQLNWQGVPYQLGSERSREKNVVRCSGQKINLKPGDYDKTYLLATAVGGKPLQGAFVVDGQTQNVWIPDWRQSVGQWNSRLVGGRFVADPEAIAPAYINRTPIAWYGSHYHTEEGTDRAYEFTYLYVISLDLPKGAKTLTLPDNESLRVVAATQVKTNRDPIRVAQPLYDATNQTVVDLRASRLRFTDQTIIEMSSPIPGAEIRYTLDGSGPTSTSTLYTQPLNLTETTRLQARALRAGLDDRYVAKLEVKREIPRQPILIDQLDPGLLCQYYEGEWTKLPDFDSLKVQSEMTVPTIALSPQARPEKFALRFTGFVRVPETGMYTLYTNSDDGSALYIGDQMIVNNDGIHGSWEEGGEIALAAGLHPITVAFFQRLGGIALSASIEGPGLAKQTIPPGMLFHAVK